MARIVEAPGSRRFSRVANGSGDLIIDWNVQGLSFAEDVEALIEANSATVIGDRVLTRISSKPVAYDKWTGESVYTYPDDFRNNEPPEIGEASWDFDTTGATTKITKSKFTLSSYAAPGSVPPNFKTLIGVSKDGVEGTEVEVKALRLNYRRRLAAATVTEAFLDAIVEATKTQNSEPFLSFDPGECLLHGVTGRQLVGGDWDMHYAVGVSKNQHLTIGDITGIYKPGWDYLWVYSEPELVVTVGGSDVVAMVPKFAYVEVVYSVSDWAGIGIYP